MVKIPIILSLQCAYGEVIFTDKRRKQGVPELLTLPDVARVSSLKILGVTITNRLSASEQLRDVIINSAQTLHALRVLRAHGIPDEAQSSGQSSAGCSMRPARGVASSPPLTASESTPSSGVVNASDSAHRIWCHTTIC